MMTLDDSPSEARTTTPAASGRDGRRDRSERQPRRLLVLLVVGATALASLGAAPAHADTHDDPGPVAPTAPRIAISATNSLIPPGEATATATLTSTVESLTGVLRLELYPPSTRPCTGEPAAVALGVVEAGNAEVDLSHTLASTAEPGLWHWRARLQRQGPSQPDDDDGFDVYERLDECRSMLVQHLDGPDDPRNPSAVAREVTTQFEDLIGRGPTAGELTLWTALIAGDHATVGDLVAALRGSDDHRTNVDPVVRLYQAYFLRTPDADGLRYWIEQRRSGRSLVSVSEFFSRSPEFQNRYGALSDADFVDLIYTNILERGGDENGAAYWVDQLTRGLRTRGDVMVGFSESPEYARAQAHEVTVSVLFVLLLDRAPDGRELALYVGMLDLVPVASLEYTVGDLADELLERRRLPVGI